MDGVACVSGVHLSPAEQVFFSELFDSFDVDKSSLIRGSQASTLLLASQLPTETLQLITELSGAKRVGHFGRVQFYRALKLIAAAQAGMKPSNEAFSNSALPLPQLNMSNPTATSTTTASKQQMIINNNNNTVNNTAVNCFAAPVPNATAQDSSPGEDSPQDSSPKEKTWASFQRSEGDWSSSTMLQLHSEEQRHLLGGNPEEDEEVDDLEGIWSITREQRAYYTKQFQSMQTDLTHGKIKGQVAKDFFEKSKLPVAELSRIWQLSDIDRDGSLALDEFCTAMHLVVLRRNGIELPLQLPPSLLPDIPPLIQTSPLPQPSQPSTGNTQHITTEQGNSQPQSLPSQGSVSATSPLNSLSNSKQWMKFSPSPTSLQASKTAKAASRDVRESPSVGTGPVSFDFSKTLVIQDPRILHPVARRVSPETGQLNNNNVSSCDLNTNTNIKTNSVSASGYVIMNNPSESDALDATSLLGTTSSYSAPGDPVSNGTKTPLAPKKEPPPPPPPRPHKPQHARSSSLDLNIPRKPGLAPPAVPPRSSPANGTNVARSLSGESSRGGLSNLSNPPKIGSSGGGAFQVYGCKKAPLNYSGDGVAADDDTSCSSSSSSSCNSSYEDLSLDPTTDDAAMLLVDDDHTDMGFMDTSTRRKHDLPDAMMAQFITEIPTDREQLLRDIGAHRERNGMLREYNKDLHDELQQLIQERLSLQNQKQPTSTI